MGCCELVHDGLGRCLCVGVDGGAEESIVVVGGAVSVLGHGLGVACKIDGRRCGWIGVVGGWWGRGGVDRGVAPGGREGDGAREGGRAGDGAGRREGEGCLEVGEVDMWSGQVDVRAAEAVAAGARGKMGEGQAGEGVVDVGDVAEGLEVDVFVGEWRRRVDRQGIGWVW